MAELIREYHCERILYDINSKFALVSFEVKPLEGEGLGGLIGLHFKLHIQYRNGDELEHLQLFVKVLNNYNQLMYKISQSLCFFGKEKLFLMTLMPLYEKVGIDVGFAPHGYLCEDEAIILEDLSLDGFNLTPKLEPLDLEHCHSSLTTIAKFHASSMIYEICKSKSSGVKFSLFEEYQDLLSDLIVFGGDNCGALHIQKSIEAVIELAEIEFFDDEQLKSFKATLASDEINNDFSKWYCTILHGDLWSNNLLYKYQKNKCVETKVIDFQLIKYGPPALDVLQFIYLNTRKNFRDENFEKLTNYYYQILDEILHDHAISIEDVIPREEFFKSCEELKVLAKLQALLDRCLTCIPDEDYLNTLQSEESFRDYIFENRAKYVIDFYTRIPEFKDIICEDLKELKEMICRSK